jgi:hypothetical protein
MKEFLIRNGAHGASRSAQLLVDLEITGRAG